MILDLTVPGGMGGREAARQLLTLDPQARLIVSTGYTSDLSIADWSHYRFSGFLAKPYSAVEMTRVLELVLSHSA
ncbi:hypothetical protein GMLC_28780 [Geomonas limicola]|uniref:Response regulatory domain-containing protein n=1 Tax=Geomonas limicola TaxID=2740186 RepID=A0A6V8NDW1_9BACT|nr:hypothetical protein [Geomonas limicola]GFO69299.1 hypothetical protein GMLC_28780 [Geomonas limicola]